MRSPQPQKNFNFLIDFVELRFFNCGASLRSPRPVARANGHAAAVGTERDGGRKVVDEEGVGGFEGHYYVVHLLQIGTIGCRMEVFRCIYEIILSEFVAFDFNEIGVVGGKKRGVGVEMDGFDTPKTLQATPCGGVGWGSGVGRKRKGKRDFAARKEQQKAQ